jgi:hypothetical protein
MQVHSIGKCSHLPPAPRLIDMIRQRDIPGDSSVVKSFDLHFSWGENESWPIHSGWRFEIKLHQNCKELNCARI